MKSVITAPFSFVWWLLYKVGRFFTYSLGRRGHPAARTLALAVVIGLSLVFGAYANEQRLVAQAHLLLLEYDLIPPGTLTVRADVLEKVNPDKWNECIQSGRGPMVKATLKVGGFKQPALDEALAVTCAESTWLADAVGSAASVGVDLGYCQLNTHYQRPTMEHFGYDQSDLMDGKKNARACKYIYDTQGGWGPWYASNKNHGMLT